MFYKTRFWVRVKNEDFNLKFETIARIEILPEEFVEKLSWNAQKTAKNILDDALLIERAESKQPKKIMDL